jgi:hypothetical protein
VSRAAASRDAVTTTARNTVACGAVKALATTPPAVAFRTPRRARVATPPSGLRSGARSGVQVRVRDDAARAGADDVGEVDPEVPRPACAGAAPRGVRAVPRGPERGQVAPCGGGRRRDRRPGPVGRGASVEHAAGPTGAGRRPRGGPTVRVSLPTGAARPRVRRTARAARLAPSRSPPRTAAGRPRRRRRPRLPRRALRPRARSLAEVGEAEGPARHRHTLAVASERSTASSTRSRSGRNALQTRRRVGHVVTGHAQDRGLERVERVLLQLGRDLRPHAESAARLVHDNAATGATHGVEHGRHVQGRQRPQVHDLQVAPSVSATAAASRQVRTVGPCATSVRSLPGRTTRAACRGSGA